MTARSPIGSAVATQRGDDGTTGLLFGGPRVRKDDPRTEAYGTVDEAVAALGIARAKAGPAGSPVRLLGEAGDLAELLLRLQRELFVVGAELATTSEARAKPEDGRTRVSEAMVDGLETLLLDLERRIKIQEQRLEAVDHRLGH